MADLEITSIDLATLGVSREKHHRYLAGDAATQGFLLYEGDACLAYVYVNAGGHIGPLAVTRSDRVGAAFASALHRAIARGASQVSAFLPGVSEEAFGSAIASGLRITFPMVLLSSHAFGDWTRYLPRNPGFM